MKQQINPQFIIETTQVQLPNCLLRDSWWLNDEPHINKTSSTLVKKIN